jgi:hypothetical protein
MYKDNITTQLLINLQMNNLLRRDMENDMMKVYSLGKEYRMEMYRKTNTLFSNSRSNSFTCYIDIYNIFNKKVFTILDNEINISKIIDTLYFFINNYIENQDMILGINGYENDILSVDRLKYLVYCTKIGTDRYRLVINEQNNILNTIIPRVTLLFDDEGLSNFIDSMYFMFLIDIDDGTMLLNLPYDMYYCDPIFLEGE